MPRPRLGLKSRTGCKECKRRRVKCDEHQPRCGECSRLQLECSYASTTPYLWRSQTSRRGGEEKSRKEAPMRRSNPIASDNPSSQRMLRMKASPNEGAASFTLEDMRLLHHFSSHTAMTLSDLPEAQQTWSTAVVQVALSHPFLLQGILALSALHMASLETGRERERLSILAASKQDGALKEFRSQVRHITRQNCDSLFAFSFLTEFYIPASAGTVLNPSAKFMDDDLFKAVLDWLRLHQGTSAIYKGYGHLLSAGSLAPLWNDISDARSCVPSQAASWAFLPSTHDAQYFQQLWAAIKPNCITSMDMDTPTIGGDEENEVNMQALMVLADIFSRTQPPMSCKKSNGEVAAELLKNPGWSQGDQHSLYDAKDRCYLSHSFSWLFGIPTGYVELLKQRRPVSLIIFAHFALLLHNAPKLWWNKDMAVKIIKAVIAVLPTEFQQYINWPVQEVI